MNDAKFKALTAQEQTVIVEDAAAAIKMQRGLAKERAAARIDQLKAAGNLVNTDVDGAAFQAVAKPV